MVLDTIAEISKPQRAPHLCTPVGLGFWVGLSVEEFEEIADEMDS